MMSEDPENLHPEEERELEDLFRPLRDIQVPPEARGQIRRLALAELERRNSPTRPGRIPWWRQTVAIPAPIVAAALLLIAALGIRTSSDRGGASPEKQGVRSIPTQVTVEAQPRIVEASPIVAPPRFERRQDQVYVCGVGLLTSQSISYLREDVQ